MLGRIWLVILVEDGRKGLIWFLIGELYYIVLICKNVLVVMRSVFFDYVSNMFYDGWWVFLLYVSDMYRYNIMLFDKEGVIFWYWFYFWVVCGMFWFIYVWFCIYIYDDFLLIFVIGSGGIIGNIVL